MIVFCKKIVLLLFCCVFPTIVLALSLDVQIQLDNKNLKETLENNLSIVKAQKEKSLTATRIEYLHESTPNEIKALLATEGYYSPTVKESLLQNNNATFEAKYTVSPEQPIHITEVNIQILGQGDKDPILEKLKMPSFLMVGERLRHKDYEDEKKQILIETFHEGYLKAELIKHELLIDRSRHTAIINLTLKTGKQHKFGPIQFQGSHFNDAFLNKYVPFNTNDPYTHDSLSLLQKNLHDSQHFSKIRLDPKINDNDPYNTQVPLLIRLNHKPKNKYTFSAGYGTDTKARGSVTYLRRRVSQPGHTFLASAYASQIDKKAHLGYTFPGRDPISHKYQLFFTGIEEGFNKKYSRYFQTGITKSKNWENLQREWTLYYLDETYHVAKVKSHQHFLLPKFSFSWKRTYFEDEYRIMSGASFTATVQGAHKKLLSTTKLLWGQVKLKRIFPWTKSLRCIARAKLGALGTPKFDHIPLNLRFFAGGDNSVRGYAYQDLSPTRKDDEGHDVPIGGQYLVEGTLELEQAIYKSFSLATFVDNGNAFNKYTRHTLKTSIGVGLRWHTPVGPLRFDIAQSLSDKKTLKPRLHLSFSADL